MLSIDNWIVCWTPNREPRLSTRQTSGAVLVTTLGDDAYWDHRYAYTGGCCYTERHSMPLWQKIAMMFIDFHTVVVRDSCNPEVVHREFSKIDEYRRRISPDIPGAV